MSKANYRLLYTCMAPLYEEGYRDIGENSKKIYKNDSGM